MKGCVIINAFLNSAKFSEIYEYLSESFIKLDVFIDMKTNSDALSLLTINNVMYDFILFWDKDIYLCEMLEKKGYKVFNSSNSIKISDDKALTYIALMNTGIKMPKTIIAPFTFLNIGYTNTNFLEYAENELNYPFIIKENFGSFGVQVYLSNNHEDSLNIIKKINGKPFLFQELIKTSFGKDLRLQVVGNEVIASVKRIAKEGELIANVTNGGKMFSHIATKEQRDMALSVCKILKLDFAGVDILFGENDIPILCEVNSNAHFKNLFHCTKINAADYIAKYILNKVKSI